MIKKILSTLFILCFFNLVSFADTSIFEESDINLNDYMLESKEPTLNINKNKNYKKVSAKDFTKDESNGYKNGNFGIYTKGNKTTSKYLQGGIEEKHSAYYNGKYVDLETGIYNSYTNANAQNGTNELYFSPKIKCTNNISLELNNYMDAKGNYFGNELGLKYKTKYLKNGSVGVSGGAKFNKDSTWSEKIKFSTDFFLF